MTLETDALEVSAGLELDGGRRHVPTAIVTVLAMPAQGNNI